MRQVSLHNIIIPEQRILNKTPSKPKSVVFTNRYLHTSKQQRMRFGTTKNLAKAVNFDIMKNPQSTANSSSVYGSFPLRRTSTNSHHVLYKHRHPKLHKLSNQSFPFNFKIQQASDSSEVPWRFSQSARFSSPCNCKSKGSSQGSFFNVSRKQSLKQPSLQDSRRNKLKGIDSVESLKIDGWNTIPVLSKDGIN